MFKESDKEFSFETEILSKGVYIKNPTTNPEVAPIFMTTAFNVEDLDDLEKRYSEHGFCYNRNRNPNRSALAELMTYLEHGEDSIACSSGMAAISTAALSIVKQGDHILSDMTLYGESMEIFSDLLGSYGVETTFIDFTDPGAGEKEHPAQHEAPLHGNRVQPHGSPCPTCVPCGTSPMKTVRCSWWTTPL